MRRVGGLWEKVVSFENLLLAAETASRGKRSGLSAARFLERAEFECLAIQRELLAGTWRPSPVSTFEVLDPKRRTITASPFRDQVVHHALMAHLAPVLDRRMIHDSYACRRGKGTHAALARTRHFVRRFAFFLKLDIKSFFETARHDVVLTALSRRVKDRRALHLCATILAGPPGREPAGVGLPIGALTSQWFANLLLDSLDHFAKETLRVPGYVRYMDDVLCFDDRRARLHEVHREIGRFVEERLRLRLKPSATIVAPVTEGVPFLGWMIFRGTTRIRPGNLRRYRWRLRQRRWETATGRRSEESFVRGVASLHELLTHGSTLGLRRAWGRRVDFDP